MNVRDDRPLVALTMGDVAGVGPEVIARAWGDSPLRTLARPFVVGSRSVLERALACMGVRAAVQEITRPEDAEPTARTIPCLEATARGRRERRRPAGSTPRRPRGVRLPDHGRRPGPRRPGRRDHDPPPEQGSAPRRGHPPPRPHRDPGRALRRDRPRDDALRRPAARRGRRRPRGRPRHPARRLRRVFDLLTEEAVESKILLADRAMRPLAGGRRAAGGGRRR